MLPGDVCDGLWSLGCAAGFATQVSVCTAARVGGLARVRAWSVGQIAPLTHDQELWGFESVGTCSSQNELDREHVDSPRRTARALLRGDPSLEEIGTERSRV